MTVTKSHIVASVIENVRLRKRQKERQRFLFSEFDYEVLSKKRATELVDGLFEILKKTLASGEHVLIPGFGKFQVQFKWARKGRNPRTGESIILDSRRRVSFRSSPKLKDKVNNPGPEDPARGTGLHH